jgi:predicted RNA-binding Zn-ribbon protein involved in translation (DUF1610 family)
MSDAKVVSIESLSAHISGPTLCRGCGHTAVSVAPCGTTLPMECSACGAFKVVWRDHILPPEGAMAWACNNCGETLFTAYVAVLTQETTMLCAGCGAPVPITRLLDVPPPLVTR